MDDDEARVVDHAERNEPDFAIVLPVVTPRQNIAFEDQGCVDDIDAPGPQDLLPLVVVPFEIQGSDSNGAG
jgi:hypothetical protein